MIRLLSCIALAAAALLSAATLAPTVAYAADGPYYAATPVAAPAKTVLITDGTVWHWTVNAYTASRGAQRDGIACEMVARSVGKLATFTAAGQPFDDAALTKCNARAR